MNTVGTLFDLFHTYIFIYFQDSKNLDGIFIDGEDKITIKTSFLVG